jgi:hypothetical protein
MPPTEHGSPMMRGGHLRHSIRHLASSLALFAAALVADQSPKDARNLLLVESAGRPALANALESKQHAIELDAYGGLRGFPAPGGVTGSFRVAKMNTRWVFVTPEGNAFWFRGVAAVAPSTSVDDRGGTYRDRVMAKYGDADLRWGPQQNRRLKAWGFNALGEYANIWTLPWATHDGYGGPWDTRSLAPFPQPVKLVAVTFPLQAAWYSQMNLFNYARGPVKEIYWALDTHFTGYRGMFPDIFDPNFDLWVKGRVASSEYATMAASPWLLGMGSDDADYLTGFGPGPDFDTGHTHPHLGYVTLLTPPTQTSNPRHGVTYIDPKVHIKYALQDFLKAKYGTIEALNAAWRSNYTTFGSDGGWPSGRGLLDEDGKGPWVGPDSDRLSKANPTLQVDLDSFLYEIAKRYFSIYRTRIKHFYPNTLYLGPSTIGGWGGPPRRQILEAAGEYVDVIRTTYNGDQARLDFIAQHAGDKPLMTWLGAVANSDSAFFRYPARGQSSVLTTQAQRGAYYRSRVVGDFRSVVTATRVKPFVGIQWWEFLDNWSEKANWGLVTLSDNAYDGKEASRTKTNDPWGFPAGAEERDFGDLLSHVRQANVDIVELLREELVQLSGRQAPIRVHRGVP